MTGHNEVFAKKYKTFEDKFRGSKELITSRISAYLPLINELKERSAPPKAIDIGSGRGEWLELIAGHGWECAGVDSNKSMADTALIRGIRTFAEDALTYLSRVEDGSQNLITAFHVVEHIETDYLLQLLQEAHRVLAPGGMIILETPNPENLSVGTWTFHLDPTHLKPIPPLLLQFFVEQAGFSNASVLRLNGTDAPEGSGDLEFILTTMFQSGRDYAILGQKPGELEQGGLIGKFLERFNEVGPARIDVFLNRARRMDSACRQHVSKASENAGELSRQATLVKEMIDSLSRQQNVLSQQQESLVDMRSQIADQQDLLVTLGSKLSAIHGSRSWKLLTVVRVYVIQPVRKLFSWK